MILILFADGYSYLIRCRVTRSPNRMYRIISVVVVTIKKGHRNYSYKTIGRRKRHAGMYGFFFFFLARGEKTSTIYFNDE